MANPNFNTEKESLTQVDKEFENGIRPSQIDDFSGQQQIIENLIIFIRAAKFRGEA
jgi:Holliday junction DNA helicase RuvB